MNNELYFYQEDIEQRVRENRKVYFDANECYKHPNCFGCPDYNNSSNVCNLTATEESYCW